MTRSKDKTPIVDDSLMEAIRKVVKEETKVVCDKLDTAITKLEKLSTKYEEIEKGLEDCAAKIERTTEIVLPKLQKKISEIATELTMRNLQADCYQRKWSLIVQGVKGEANETCKQTAQKCTELAKTYLGVHDAKDTDFAACHRLKHELNAGIIVRFVDLTMRDRWLAGARGLANCPDKISMSPDLPPATRCLRKDLMKKRATLPTMDKRNSTIKYLKVWPFVQLAIKGKPSLQPTITKEQVTESLLGTSLFESINLV